MVSALQSLYDNIAEQDNVSENNDDEDDEQSGEEHDYKEQTIPDDFKGKDPQVPETPNKAPNPIGNVTESTTAQPKGPSTLARSIGKMLCAAISPSMWKQQCPPHQASPHPTDPHHPGAPLQSSWCHVKDHSLLCIACCNLGLTWCL